LSEGPVPKAPSTFSDRAVWGSRPYSLDTFLCRFGPRGNFHRRIEVSIIRIGLAETKNFGEGYEAIFGKNKPAKKTKNKTKAQASKKKKSRKK
jgi:hypothetical protein